MTRLSYDPETMVPIPTGLLVRLVDRARRQLAAELRLVDPDADDVELLERWLGSRPGSISLPFPSAEPGDLLVKLARSEFWNFTVGGWRELAPVEVVFTGVPSGPWRPDFLIAPDAEAPHFGDHGARMKGLGSVAAPDPRFVATPEETDAARRRRGEAGLFSGGIGGRQVGGLKEFVETNVPRVFPPIAVEVLEDLLQMQHAVEKALELAADLDIGTADGKLRGFMEGVNTARVALLDAATRHTREVS